MAIVQNADPELLKQLQDEGIVPKNCREVSMDLPFDDAVMVTYRCYIGGENMHRIIDALTTASVAKT